MYLECDICLTNEVKSLSQLNSNHLFHSDCIDKWLKQNDTCPLCRAKFNDFNEIEKIKSKFEIEIGKIEQEWIIKREEKNRINNEIKKFKIKVDDLQSKEKPIKSTLIYTQMNRTENELEPGFRRSRMNSIKGDRTRHVIAMNPNKANPGEELYIEIAKLKPDSCLVPGSFHLLFDLKISNTKTRFLNNLSKLLQKRLQTRLAGETAYDNNGESLYGVHKDLYETNTERENMIQYDIASENLRKLISKDDSGTTSGDTTKVSEKLMYDIYDTK